MTSAVLTHRPSLGSSNPGTSGLLQGLNMSATTPGASGGLSLPSPIIGFGNNAPPSFTVSGSKPVPMKLFATWEVDRTPPNCIPRLCSLTLTRLVVFKALGSGIGSVVIAVKMEGSKRTLRSNEIVIPAHPESGNGGKILDTELELTFSLQYPHFVKRGGNRLHVMLQRRKRYKNRAILVGFKTLAVGTVDMCQVLQKQIDLELELYAADSKNAANLSNAGTSSDIVVGKVSVFSLSSQPVDSSATVGSSTPGRQKGRLGDNEDDRTETGSEDDDDESSSPESDSAEDTPRRKSRGSSNQERGVERGASGGKTSSSARQQNLKQKFMALMKKFKVEGLGRVEQVELDRELSEAAVDPAEIDYLFDQLEEEDDDLSDSGPDTISVGSTPKPSLKPFFCSSRSDLHETRMMVSHTLSGGGMSKLNSGAKADDHKVDMMAVGTCERYSDDSAKDPGPSGLALIDTHLNLLTDDQDNEMSDPPIIGTTTTNTTTASSGDEAPRRDRASKKADRPFTMMKQQQQQQQQQQQGSHHLQQPHKVLKERQSNELLQAQRYPSHHAQHQGIEVASANATRKALLEQLSRVLPNDVDTLPDMVLLANTADHYGARLAEKLSDNGGFKVVCATNPAEVKASLTCIVAKIQKFCNTQTWESPPLVKVALIGADDAFVSSALRAYVEVFSSKPPDWQSFVKFYIVPPVISGHAGNTGSSSSTAVARYISSKDDMYAQLFVHPSWRELLDGKEDDGTKEIVARIVKYLNASDNSPPMQLPVAEAMVTYKEEKSSGEESSQVFLPFLSDVRVGSDVLAEADDSLGQGSSPSDRLTPPSSPRLPEERSEGGPAIEPVDLQLDYWVVSSSSEDKSQGPSSGSSKKTDLSSSSGYSQSNRADAKRAVETTGNKSSIKASILHMQVQRLGDHPFGFTMTYWTSKDKKPKATVIRLGKKKTDQQKEREIKSFEGITRLICLSKGHNSPLKVQIDGSEWSGVKFFQLSAQWQTHIKFFPVATLQNRATGESHMA